jgi:hypothetical protein
METKQISKKAKKAGINEIAKACERMVNDVVTMQGSEKTRIGHKRVWINTTQIGIIISDCETIFLDDLNDLIGVQYIHYNKYNHEMELSFVLRHEKVEEILKKYGKEE